MKEALLILIFLLPICGSPQDILGSWSWQAENGKAQMELTLAAEGSEYTSHYCAVLPNGDRLDFVDEDEPASILVIRTAENKFEGTIRSGYRDSEGKIRMTFDPEEKILFLEILEEPDGIYYLPAKAMFNSRINKANTIPEEESEFIEYDSTNKITVIKQR